MKTAPIVLFVYARLEHTRKTVEALLANELAKESDLYVFVDAPKTKEKQEAVEQVRAYIATIAGFRSVTINHRPENYGLARNIIEGVTEVVNAHGRVIVIEDDIVTSPAFLSFMNQSLDYYADEKRVWHVAGWNFPINPEGLGGVFFSSWMNCWGWGTWADSWQHFEKKPERLIETWDAERINYFNLDGARNSWGQVTSNQSGRINTWAVFWHATIIENNALCLNPSISHTENIGMDGTGRNCGKVMRDVNFRLAKHAVISFEQAIEANNLARARVIYYINRTNSIRIRVINKIGRIIVGRNIIQ